MTLRTVITTGLMFTLLYSIASADDRRDFLGRLINLQISATSVTLMVVPKGLQFLTAISQERLPANACSYQVESDGAASFGAILELLERSVDLDETERLPLQQRLDIRIGLIFKNGADVVEELFFEDSIGERNIKGYSTSKRHSIRLWAQASFPDRLRSFVTRPDVIPIDSRQGNCPHR
jgi:hypothetical protein